MPTPDLPELLTISEAARLINVHPNTLRNWEKAGRITAIRLGSRRDRRYPKDSLRQLFMPALLSLVLLLAIPFQFNLFSPTQAQAAAISKIINFQGKITNVTGGTNVTDGTYAMEFKLYDALTSGTLLWTETYDQSGSVCVGNNAPKVQLTSGIFNVKLGSCNSLAGVDFTAGSLYLTVNFAPTGTSYDGEMSPRKQLNAAAFAFNANNLAGDGRIDLTYAPGNTTNPGGKIAYNPSVSSSNNALAVSANSNVSGAAMLITQAGTGVGIELAGAGSAARTINSTSTALTLQTTTSGDINITSAGNINFNSPVIFAANKGVTVTAGTSAFDFSGGSGLFKTSTGAVTIGPGTTTLSGTAINLSGSSPVIDLTSATTLSINTTTNRPVTFGTGLVKVGGKFAVGSISAVPSGTVQSSTTMQLEGSASSTLTVHTTTGDRDIFLEADDGTSSSYIGTTGSVPIKFRTANADRFILASTGEVGVGTSTPVDPFSITTAINASGTHALFNLSNTALSSGSGNGTYIGANPGSFTGNFVDFQVNNSSKFSVSSGGLVTTAGNIAVNGGSITSTGNLTLDPTSTVIIGAGDTFQTDDVTSTGALSLVSAAASAININPGTTGDVVFTHGNDSQLLINATPTADTNQDSVKITLNPTITGSTNTLQGLVISQSDNANTGVYDSLLKLENLKTPETTTNGLFIQNNAASNTLTNGINITNTAGTLANAISISNAGTLTNSISAPNFTLAGTGAIIAVGVNSGSGLIQGTGGLTITGTTQINATTAGTTTIGSSAAGAVQIASGSASSFNVTSNSLTLQTTTSGDINLTSAGNININSPIIFAANKGVTVTAGTSAFDFSGGSGLFKTSTGAVTIGPGAVSLSGDTTLATAKSLLAAGTAIVDFSGGSGIFKTTTGAVTIGPGTTTLSGTAINLSGSSPVIDLTTATTLSINTATNRPVTFGSGLVTYGGSITAGTNPASAGIIRIPTASFISARNNANSGDINLIQSNASDQLAFGANVAAFTLAGSITGSGSPSISSINQFSGITGVFSTSTTTPLVSSTGTLTLNSAAANNLTIDSAGAGTAVINVGTANATSVVLGRTSQTLQVKSLASTAANGVLYLSDTSGTVAETAASTGAQCLQTAGTGTAPIWGSCGGGGGTRLDQITAATATNGTGIDSTNFAQIWKWTTLTTQRGLTLAGGTAMTTGGVLDVNTTSQYVHTTTETGSLANFGLIDASTAASGATVSNVLNMSTTLNTSGAGTKTVNGLNISAPTLTACASGACTYNGAQITTQTSLANVTQTGLKIAVNGTTDTGMSITASSLTSGNGLTISGGTTTTGNLLGVTSTTTSAPTNGIVRYNFSGIRTTAGNGFVIDDASTTLATVMTLNGNSLTTGNGLVVSATATGLTGTAMSVTTGSTGVPTNGLVRFNFNGIRTAAGVGFQIDDISTTLATAMKINANSLTTGNGLVVSATATGLTGNAFSVTTGSTSAPTNGLVRFNFNGIRTAAGNGFVIDDISTTLATVMKINANSLTTGNGLAISATATGLTGNAFSVTTGSTGVPTNGLVRFNFNGIRTAAGVGFLINDISTTLATTMNIVSNSLTTGNALVINANGVRTAGSALSITSTGINAAGGAATAASISIAMPAATLNTLRYIRFANTAGTEIGSINNSAAAVIAYSTSSDRRLKTNITETHYGIEDLMRINVADFNWLENGMPDTGFIAQDLYSVYPGAVSKGDNGIDPYIPGVTNIWSVDYGKVTPLIIKGVQDQQRLIGDISQMEGLGTLVETIGSEAPIDPVSVIADKITNGKPFLTNFFSARVSAVRGSFKELSGLEVTSAKITAQGLRIDSISAAGDIISLLSDVLFIGRPYFNADTAGFAQIKEGARKVNVEFTDEYLAQPIVNISISLNAKDDYKNADNTLAQQLRTEQEQLAQSFFDSGIQYAVINKNEKGFTILLNKSAPKDVTFSWIALAVKDAKISLSDIGDQPSSSSWSGNSGNVLGDATQQTPDSNEAPPDIGEQSGGEQVIPSENPTPDANAPASKIENLQ